MINFKKGTPPKIDGTQYILRFKLRPDAVGTWNSYDGNWAVANVQMSPMVDGLKDYYYETEYYESNDIVGYCEI